MFQILLPQVKNVCFSGWKNDAMRPPRLACLHSNFDNSNSPNWLSYRLPSIELISVTSHHTPIDRWFVLFDQPHWLRKRMLIMLQIGYLTIIQYS